MAQEDKLDWIYKGANSLVNREDYLLGRKIDKTLEQLNEEEKVKKVVLPVPKNHVEHECIPPSIRDFNKIVQSEQVDLSAKLQEDPLVAIKKREEEVRRQFLQNPVQLRKLQEALHMKEMEKKSKKHHKESMQSKKFKQEFINKFSPFEMRTPVKQSKQDKKHALDTILMHKFNAFKSKLTEEDLQEVLNGKASSSSDEDTEKKRKPTKRSRSREVKATSSSDEDKYKKRNPKKRTRSKGYETLKGNASSSSDEDRNKKRKLKNRFRSEKDEDKPKERNSHRSRDASYSRSRYESKDRRSHRSPNRKPLEDPDAELDKKIMAQLKLLRNQTEAKPKAMLPAKPSHLRSDSSSSEDESSSDSDSDSSSEAERPKTFGLVTSDGKKLAFKNKGKPITTDKRPVKKVTEAAKPEKKGVKKLSEKEKEKMRQEMMQNAKVRDKEREEHLRKYREAAKQEDESVTKKYDADLIHTQLLKSAKHTSVEDRIKSKLNTIQRSSRHMEQNFSKRL
ncbi:pre-mRNA-splicing factor CWC25 homolog [Dendroctonus ponderosae]